MALEAALFALVVGGGWTVPRPPQEPPGSIQAIEAAKFKDQTKTVCGHVAGSSRPPATLREPTMLFLERNFPNQALGIEIPDSYRHQFSESYQRLRSEDGVCISGKIQSKNSHLQIVLNDRNQLTLLDRAVPSVPFPEGIAKPTDGLDAAALAAARQWTFKAGSRNGQPVPVIQRVLETFTILPAPAGGETDAQLVPVDDEFATGARRPGLGVTMPVMLTKAPPKYTRAAMRQKIVGVVTLEAIVEKNGTVGPVRVMKSLDAQFGLDDEAIAAAKRWTFQPGTLNGQPVRVIVKLVLEFRLH